MNEWLMCRQLMTWVIAGKAGDGCWAEMHKQGMTEEVQSR